MNVTITPDSEANYILSSIASSKLKLKLDTEPVRVIKPSKPDPIIFDDPQPSGSGSNKEPQ